MDSLTYSKMPRSQIKSTKWEVERALHQVMMMPEVWGECNAQAMAYPFGQACVLMFFTGVGHRRITEAFVNGLRQSEVTTIVEDWVNEECGHPGKKVWVWPAGLMN
jgi:hypothetical protein